MLFEVKEDINLEDLQLMEPALLILYTATILYCKEFNLPCKFTSFISDRVGIVAKSTTHEDGRAFDLSVNGWTETHIHRFAYIMNNDYSDIGAISYSDNESRAAIYHDSGHGKHLHLQVRRNAKYNKFLKWDIN